MTNPISDAEILAQVRLLSSVPAFMPEPAASAVRGALLGASAVPEKMSLVLAIWPDGTWSLLAHSPDWSQPRPEQLVRAYRTAYFIGARIALPEFAP